MTQCSLQSGWIFKYHVNLKQDLWILSKAFQVQILFSAIPGNSSHAQKPNRVSFYSYQSRYSWELQQWHTGTVNLIQTEVEFPWLKDNNWKVSSVLRREGDKSTSITSVISVVWLKIPWIGYQEIRTCLYLKLGAFRLSAVNTFKPFFFFFNENSVVWKCYANACIIQQRYAHKLTTSLV